MSEVKNWRKRSTAQAREALQRLIDGCWRRGTKPCFTIPVDEERDADCIVADVITERDELERHQSEDREAIRALKAAGEQLEKAVEELLTEFVSKKRAANWGVINGAGFAYAKATIEHAAAIQRAREGMK